LVNERDKKYSIPKRKKTKSTYILIQTMSLVEGIIDM